MNYSNMVVSDERVANLHGQSILAGYKLRFGIEFTPTSGSPQHQGIEILNLRASISCGGPGTAMKHVGHALPEQPIRLVCTTEGGYRRTVLFELDMSFAQLAAIEHAREGGELEFEVVLIAEAWQNGNWTPTKQDLRYRSPISEWSRVLDEMGFQSLIVFSIPVSRVPATSNLHQASKLLDRAVDHFKHGRWSDVVSTCRLAIEAVWSAEGTVQKQAKAAVVQYMKDDERKKMSKSDRGLFVQEAMRHFAHLAHHVSADGTPEYFSNSDAAYILGLTTAALADAAARESSPPVT